MSREITLEENVTDVDRGSDCEYVESLGKAVENLGKGLMGEILSVDGKTVRKTGTRLFFPNGIELLKIVLSIGPEASAVRFEVTIAGEKGVSGAQVPDDSIGHVSAGTDEHRLRPEV